MVFSKKATAIFLLLHRQESGIASFVVPSPGRRGCSALHVSVGLGPKEKKPEDDDKEKWSEEKRAYYERHAKSLANVFTPEEWAIGGSYYKRWQDTSVPMEERNFDPYRKEWLTPVDEECDEWFKNLIGDGGTDYLPLGDISKSVYEQLHTPVPLQFDPIHPHDHPEYTRYYRRGQPNEILFPALGCEQYGMPIPRNRAEAWRHFDTMGMVGTDYSLDPKDRGTELILDEEERSKIESTLKEKGAWLDNDSCFARLMYINGRFCPSLSKTIPSVAYNLSPCDFPVSDGEIAECLRFLPDGFTDEIPTEEGLADMAELAGSSTFSKLSFPDHHTGPATDEFAINGQQGTGPFAALNSLKTGAVALIRVPEGEEREEMEVKKEEDEEEEAPLPMVVINAWTADGGNDSPTDIGVACHPRTLLIAGKNSRTDLVQFVLDLDDENTRPKLHNGYTQCFLRTNAKLTHSYLEETGGMPTPDVESLEDDKPLIAESRRPARRNTHLEALDVVNTGPNSSYQGTVMQIGGSGRSRIAVRSCLLQPGASSQINGFSLAGGAQSTDFRSTVIHAVKDTVCQQLHKNLVGGRATTTYKGRIRIDQRAQGSNSDQLCRTLLLTDEAKINAIPSLEIVPDQVKCSHGATVADLSDDERFYMQSRGFSPSLARSLLMFGFAQDLFDLVSDSVQFGTRKDPNSFKNRLFKRLNNLVPKQDRSVLATYMSI